MLSTHKTLQQTQTECTFLGYSSSYKGYKCLDSNGTLFISKDVIFHESKFPFLNPQPVPPAPTVTSRLSPLGIIPSHVPNLHPSPTLPLSPTHLHHISPISPPIQHATPTLSNPHISPNLGHVMSQSPSKSLPSTASTTIELNSDSIPSHVSSQ